MKKTIKINISGLVFHIDEDAYDRLENYINRLKASFRGTQGEGEIIADIEFRIAEIFQTKINEDKEVINLDDINDVISVLGEPEEIDGSDTDTEFETSSDHEPHYRDVRKRIYRDPNNKVIGGVCGGLGEYFRIDPLIFRIIFVVAFLVYGVGLLIYLLLWIVVPEARTRTEKMEMRGEPINVSNIEKSIRKEYDRGKKRRDDTDEPRTYRRERNGFSQLMHGIGRVFLVFFKIIGGIIGISFVLAGVAILVAIIGSLIAGHTWFINDFWDISGFSIPEVMAVFMDETVAIIALIALTALIAIPVLGLIYAGVKLLFPFRANDRAIGLSGLGIWVGALVLLLIFGASEGVQHNTSARSSTSREIQMDSVNQIYLMADEEDIGQIDHVELGFVYHQDILIAEKNRELIIMGRPDVDIIKSFGNEIEVSIKKRSRGVNDDAARRLAEEIEYSYHVKDSMLVLDPYFTLPEHIKWRDQEVDIVLSLPVGAEIYLDESLRDLLQNIENLDNLWSDEMVGQAWIMTEDGLTRTTEETE
jgi:phage shock protein PspC (stress-responsive transcriptional regulator)